MAEALRLADELDDIHTTHVARNAAAELRRLHEAHDWQYKMAGERLRRIEKLEAQRDALLEVLKYLDKEFRQHGRQHWPEAVRVRAAIKVMEEGK